MKKLLTLLLLSYMLFAQNIAHTIPKALQKKLCEQLANNANRCDTGSTLDYYTHANLNNGSLLLFVYLNDHQQQSNKIRSAVPIIVDHLGRWISTIGDNSISEDIESIHQDPHGNIWVRTMWHIEGVSPAYYHSKNGLQWKQTILPANRNVDCCFEYVDKPIFLFDSITLTFRNTDNTIVKSWSSDYVSAMSNKPFWQPLTSPPKTNIENIPDTRWQVSKSNHKITFLNTFTNKKIFLPLQYNATKNIYQIQVAAYIQKSAALTGQKSLKNIPYTSYIVSDKKYNKLRIGKFTTFKQAKAVLRNLKKKYPKNKAIQNGFILKSKP
ncbi:MAG: Unknown protein [uncultured Sulfurovum sp.]|uniref:SPOR domain-containing protein n=1 Tax=uncultured Sulfurovum sp. TaxID=269237 RepID=A0A6S6SLQ0_9BACT|nr:MAG: Unknown protein [uncultured Sulfurovum sp.]